MKEMHQVIQSSESQAKGDNTVEISYYISIQTIIILDFVDKLHSD